MTGRLALLLLCLLSASLAQGHVASNSFFDLDVHGRTLDGSVELALRDVELAVGIDADGDGKITWGELRSSAPRLVAYLAGHMSLSARTGSCPLSFRPIEVNQRVDGNYAWLAFSARCPDEVRSLRIRYDVLAGIDPSHRGLLRLEAGAAVQTAVLEPGAAPVSFRVDRASLWRTVQEYFETGAWHIWSGIDHLLFLLSLLLPAVLMRRARGWEPVAGAKPALIGIIKVVTAFTIAHSITLSAAAFGIVHLPSRLTESVIAASIVVAALNNIFPVVTETRARIAFTFGLLHGFGFASVLADMGLPEGARLTSLIAFNAGIEAGQLAVVLLVMPLVYAVRRGALYRQALLPLGSAVIAALALVWLFERAFVAG